MLKMTNLIRELELKFLIELINYIDITKEWNNMYKNWIRYEYSETINSEIIQTWVSKVNDEKLFYKNIDEYPQDIKFECERIAKMYW